jgi:hypothetical protein
MGNEDGLEGEGDLVVVVPGIAAMGTLPWFSWPLQPLEGMAKGAACWKL